MARKFEAPFGKCIARRTYQVASAGKQKRRVNVEIGTPVPIPGSDWGCRVRIRGLSRAEDRTIFGIDALQALELAIRYAGTTLASSTEFRAGRLHVWNARVTNEFELAMPLALSRLRSALEGLGWYLRREKGRENLQWRAGTQRVLKAVAGDLSALAKRADLMPRLTAALSKK